MSCDLYCRHGRETRTYEYKPVDQLVFLDDFMFGAVMSEPEICKGVLELLLRVKIDHIEYPGFPCGKPMSFRVAETHGCQTGFATRA